MKHLCIRRSAVIAVFWAAIASAQAIPTTLPTLPQNDENQLSHQAAVLVSAFRFHGNTVFTDQQLIDIAEPYRIKHDGLMSGDDLEAAREAITRAYVNGGYLNSGAVLPEQTVADGVVLFEIVEGRLSRIDIHHDSGELTAPMSAAAPATQPQ